MDVVTSSTGRNTLPSGWVLDDPIIANDINSNPNKVIEQLVHQAKRTLPEAFFFDIDRNPYHRLIKSAAQTAVNNADADADAPQLINDFHKTLFEKAVEIAIKNGDIDTARQFLNSSLIDEYRSNITESLLFSYCNSYGTYRTENESLLMFELLHEFNVDFNCFDRLGNTPLIEVAHRNNYVSVLDKLIAFGADVNKTARYSSLVPLRLAACNGKLDFVQRLVASGANAKVQSVCEALHIIIDKKEIFSKPIKVELPNFLLPQRLHDLLKIEEPEDKSPAYLKIIELLVDSGVPIDTTDSRGNSLLKKTVTNGLWPVAELLITLGATIYPGIFDDAIQSNNEECIRQLIELKHSSLPKDIPYRTNASYGFGSQSKESNIKLEIFQLCVRSGMSPANFSFADSVVLKTPEAVVQCLELGKDLNIHFSGVKNGALNGYLYNAGISPGAKGCSLAHFAAACATRESLAILIHAGLDIHARDEQGLTPLHYAAAYANPEAVKLLIFAGAEIDAMDKKGMTPLHWSVEIGTSQEFKNIPCVKTLLYADANPNLKDARNRMPLDCMCFRNYATNKLEWTDALNYAKRREPDDLKAHYKSFQSLKDLSIINILNNRDLTLNLMYRTQINGAYAHEIEDVACEKLTPPD